MHDNFDSFHWKCTKNALFLNETARLSQISTTKHNISTPGLFKNQQVLTEEKNEKWFKEEQKWWLFSQTTLNLNMRISTNQANYQTT